MYNQIQEYYKNQFGINEKVLNLALEVEENIEKQFKEIELIKHLNQLKVIKALQNNKLSETCFSGTTGYGYDDKGREVLDKVYAEVFGAEDGIVRQQFVSGTHAIATCLYGNLRPGNELLSITGKPYDTLDEVIGIRNGTSGSLKEFGIDYKQVDLLEDGNFDLENIKSQINEKTKMIFIQRSKGYSTRPTIKISKLEEIIKYVKCIKNDINVFVDNCYGEFVEDKEPTHVGADLIAGSLIKNPGGGLAPTGGYVVGKKELVDNTAYRLTTPGLGRKIGATIGINRLFFQGFFMAPHVVAESLKGAVFCAALFEKLGFEVLPKSNETRSDIIQGIKFNNPELLIAFCQGIQAGSVVDSCVRPEPWEMPGYDAPVIMAAGAFIQGSSIELSADAPIKPPYTAYMQGGLVYENVKLGVLIAVREMLNKKMIKL